MNITGLFERRRLLKAAAVGGLSTLCGRATMAEDDQQNIGSEARSDQVRMYDIAASPSTKVTIERRGPIVLISINRPYIHNRIDPEAYAGLAKAYYQYDHDPSLRAAILLGHGDNYRSARCRRPPQSSATRRAAI
jgi:hypothetical protein